ncbi:MULTISPECIES: LysM peptidoglycan-binding domain-containing protein [unclassified Simplicispira]|uniref:LysM peptidoglycan-binding domain-containing protein n=1 Tax=unclassified Simplicispira TaxID=2630407 RepID=UPI000D5DFF1D|nr:MULTISPECIES: LysM peptidoglycan-binding domain-containing protein [unclassified Simplicispira]MBH1977634.1 LysM peptidoglycan-binding domain-containing protein [Comamonadaceae bacterium]PVY57327.1 LysM domain-containing protein [Simplicispira sp. 125]REG18272.1 LysM domain-containing protein [Simplicispira sp. 110]
MAAITSVRRATAGAVAFLCAALVASVAQAQSQPITASQRSTAAQVAQQGVPLTELAPDAPDTYVVKRGDTLWAISGMYLKRPWRWPELWGMNLQAIHNPHLIFPGQTLYLDKTGGVARLRTTASGAPETVRVSPRTRSDSLSDTALPTLKPHLIEPFLAEPLVVDAETLKQAPRIVGTFEERVLMSTGDRIYARGDAANPLRTDPGEPRQFRVFRDAVALKDPQTGDILGYEAQYLGQAVLVRGETFEDSSNGKGGMISEYVPASLDITGIKEEIRTGDRLLPAPPRMFTSYIPHAPQLDLDARVVSIYGSSAMANAAQNDVVAINLGEQDGIEVGHVLSLMTKGNRIRDVNDGVRTDIKLPSERNGMAMVFRTFNRVSYALILDVNVPVRVGDRLVNPD